MDVAVTRRKHIQNMSGTPAMGSSFTWVKLVKSTTGIEKQGGFARLIRGSHALEDLVSIFTEEVRSKDYFLSLFVSDSPFSYSLP